MALADPYIDVAYYQARSTLGMAVGNPTALLQDATAASRILDRQLGIHDGALNSHTATYEFDGRGLSVLRLRDQATRAYFLRSVGAGGISVDTGRDGSYGMSFDLSAAWVRGTPANNAALGQPFTAIELLPLAVAPILVWPDLPAAVRISGTWGWAAVPDPIKAIVVSMTRELRDHFGAGAVPEPAYGADDSLPLSDQTWRLIASAKKQFRRRLPGIV